MKKHNRFVTTMLTGTALLGLLSANAGAVRAVPSTHKLYVNNQLADVAAYNIAGNNYFKLRDIAKLVGFGVAYDPQVNSVALASNQPYQDDGSGGGAKATVQATDNAQPSPQTIYVDGAQQSPTVYNINGNNYFKLRDLGEMIDFGVTFTAATSRVDIDTEKPYAAEPTTPTAPTTPTPDNTEQGDQDAAESTMKEVSNNPGYFYDTSLLTVPPEVEGLPLSELKQKLPDLEQRLHNWELAMVDAVNEERRNVGLNELVIDEDTMGFSQYWAEHMATNEFRHSARSDAREYAKIAGLSDLEPAEINGLTDKRTNDKVANVGENIAGTPLIGNPVERMMKALMNSPGHKAAILDADAKTIGTGLAVSEKGAIYCCQNFGLVLYED